MIETIGLLLCIIFGALIAVVLFTFYHNNYIEISRLTHYDKEIPAEFEGFRILHVSDLHNKLFGK